MIPPKSVEQADAQASYNAFLAVCPSRQLLDRISNKWVVLVLCALAGDAAGTTATAAVAGNSSEPAAGITMRYSALSRLLGGVSQKMLTQTLRALERDGLLTRTVAPTVPVTVTYELTDLGRSLYNVVQGLRYWAQENMGEVSAHRKEYDDAAG
ncbi:helix-turn-helix domain-containing protein [Arthrobacter sp. zg-Y1143]|uniref:winged helix-turn-helix transcriptional regulator n=1 Tax=Arthrobacter sp. zg-Y1143 TaxID=3049065 RepID=UPI0024C2EA41|nr:helix-turn-helix domain-containing protein [Arthrobacter sp. zg-Y1143]MDK1329144.1 helix-turn-helix domain-containing protein [Arthrobacter sp. zg-Y1143]